MAHAAWKAAFTFVAAAETNMEDARDRQFYELWGILVRKCSLKIL